MSKQLWVLSNTDTELDVSAFRDDSIIRLPGHTTLTPLYRVYVCTDHAGHWPVGVASVIVAQNEEYARKVLDAELVARGLKPFADEPYTLQELDMTHAHAVVLHSGDY